MQIAGRDLDLQIGVLADWSVGGQGSGRNAESCLMEGQDILWTVISCMKGAVDRNARRGANRSTLVSAHGEVGASMNIAHAARPEGIGYTFKSARDCNSVQLGAADSPLHGLK